MNDKLDTQIEQGQPVLTDAEKALLFGEIEKRVTEPVVSPYFVFMQSRTMTTLLLALVLTLGTTGTVLASEQSKPGDLLFPVERAAEEIRLALAKTETKASLQAQFNEERLAELKAIIEEERTDDSSSSATSTDSTTVVVSSEGEARIGAAVQILLDYIEATEVTTTREAFLTALLKEVDGVKVSGRLNNSLEKNGDTARIKIDDSRIEVREDGYRVRIDDDGEVRIKRDDDWSESGRTDDSSLDDSGGENSDDSFNATFEAEADVFFDTTIVEVEINDRKSVFETSADTKAEVVAEIARRYGIEGAVVEAALDFEVEDRSSRSRDGDSDDDDSRDSNGDDDSSDESDGRTGIKKFEVRVEGLTAQVRIEYGSNKKLEYDTLYTTKAALLAEVALKTGLASADLSSALDLEVK